MRWAYEVRLSSSPSTHLPAPGHLHNQSCPDQHNQSCPDQHNQSCPDQQNSAPILQAQGHCCPFPQQADEADDTVNFLSTLHTTLEISSIQTQTRVASKIAFILLQGTLTEPQVQLLLSCKKTDRVVMLTSYGRRACYLFLLWAES